MPDRIQGGEGRQKDEGGRMKAEVMAEGWLMGVELRTNRS
jgi:hypothetical protein